MLGNSPDRRLLASIAVLVATLALAGCARNVKQDAHSGGDAKSKGAKAIVLDANEGSSSGIVTYPGGDRVDWKLVEIPEGKSGELKVELRWTPPRPGLDLAFDVYNEYGRKLGGVKPKKPSATKKSKRKRSKKSTTIKGAKGKVYIEVYASNRGDAGKYKLSVAFEETVSESKVFDPGAADIPQPPRLASVPPPCDLAAIDPKNPECEGKHPLCDKANPDPENPNCKGINKPCDPNALDPLNPNCLAYYPECDPTAIDKKNPKCNGVVPPPPKPTDALVIAVEVTANGTIIHINKGTKEGIDRNWKGELVDGAGRPVANSNFVIYKAQERKSFAKVKIGRDVVNKNINVKLYPP